MQSKKPSLPRLSLAACCAAACWLGATSAQAALPRPVQWSAAQMASADLRIEHLTPANYRTRFTASATVQSPSDLLRSLTALDAARSRLKVAQSGLQLAAMQAQRDQGLFEAGQNVALAEVQQAQAAAEQARAEVDSAHAAVDVAQAQLTAQLGTALASQLSRQTALRQAILNGSELIVDLTLPPGRALPQTAQVELHIPGSQRTVHARVIGPAAAASSQLQGWREVLIAPAAPGLMPGLELVAEVQSARVQSGVRLPSSSVVWTDAEAVVFVSTKADGKARHFTARKVSTAWPLQGGYVQPGWGAVDVVTRGAGLVLTPPPKPHALPAVGGDDD
ncbi:efflux RND transporter periplasmic adaptor subunit [Thiomonas arsenitoxydans]|uniref:efflux RND transporter periplasmic adaptor subunit n=1 Tax=Thiomonas arsenitoxydans (strain DSM 22701 / CIP 110005 / 3As) TaxID=426114 RepID=UPI001AD087A9|nr:efflux RND transporter periplasmic adaptor subunit [Thiomonas arsenitoxydans]MBN8775770.1 efflux RND transporter periplasmic adaptor subunit [Thiomonas arsenitoxydans]